MNKKKKRIIIIGSGVLGAMVTAEVVPFSADDKKGSKCQQKQK